MAFSLSGGEQYGDWTVVSGGLFAAREKVSVVCQCGSQRSVDLANLKSGRSTSCGCKSARSKIESHHGMTKSPTWWTWIGMRARCLNVNHSRYKDYGGRGITVCESWGEFKNFLTDVGIRPDGKTLDRIDVNGNYEPSNCRWATPVEQSNNTRRNK